MITESRILGHRVERAERLVHQQIRPTQADSVVM
jgi:hypothetical protein